MVDCSILLMQMYSGCDNACQIIESSIILSFPLSFIISLPPSLQPPSVQLCHWVSNSSCSFVLQIIKSSTVAPWFSPLPPGLLIDGDGWLCHRKGQKERKSETRERRERKPHCEWDILLTAYVKQVSVNRSDPSHWINVTGVPRNKTTL